jgi:hypothetical protein
VLLEGAQMGDRLNYKPETAAAELGKLDSEIAQSLKEIEAMGSDEKIGDMAKKALAHLRDVAPAQ